MEGPSRLAQSPVQATQGEVTMPRARTGTLIYKRTTGWNARIWVDVQDPATGALTQERRWVPLATHDKDLAKRKVAKVLGMLQRGELMADAAPAEATRRETFADFASSWREHRKAIGVVMARDEAKWLDDYIEPEIGHLALEDVRPVHVRKVLARAIEAGRQRETVRKIRGVVHRVLDAAWKAELIKENPVERVDVPTDAPVDDRPRKILSDEQVLQFLNAKPSGPDGKAPRADAADRLLELKTIAVCARVLGGLRTAEVNRWDWSMVDRVHFAEVKVQRAKAKRGHTGKVQPFIVPEPMRPVLRAWHERHGAPEAGPVFPVTKGARKGETRKERGTSYASRLRRELWRAGIRDHDVHHDTPTSKKVDFHSFRRAFATSLAEANVNEQRARFLVAHGDASVHARYVQNTRAMQVIPDAAVPALDAAAIVGKVTAVTEALGPSEKHQQYRHAR